MTGHRDGYAAARAGLPALLDETACGAATLRALLVFAPRDA